MAMDQRLLDINQYGVLNAPPSLWWCTIFLLRHWILLLVLAGSALVSPGSAAWASGALAWPSLVAEAPMLLLAYAWARRTPEAGPSVRRVWRHGRELVTLTAGLGVAVAAWTLWGRDEWRPWPERFIVAMALIDLAIILGTWRSIVFRTLFSEFPPAPAPVAQRRP